jgi:ABC-2 type transport system ATP-binding protein
MIVIEKLTKRYGDSTIFEDIDLSFPSGAIIGLVGENGCGKTTLMRCICGFTKPSEGRVTVLGKVIGKDMDFAPSTGIIIENSGFLNHYSARQNLALLADISGKADKQRIDEVIRLVGLDPDSKKHVGKYSLGMTQRLAIAQAIMEDPDILILDEPFNGLDKQGQADIHELLQSLKAQGKTILLASHSAGDISRACDMIFEFLHGKITRVVQ